MTLLNSETGELLDVMSADEAEHATEAIAWRLDTIATTHAEVMPMIRDALSRRAWEVLGYRSPGEYAADRFGGALTRLSIPVRQAVVQELTDAGMSTRAIAPVVGVSHESVRKDQAGVNRLTPETPQGEASAPEDQAAPAVSPSVEPSSSPRPAVTGIDGKTYTPPAPKPRPVASVPSRVDEFTDQDRAEEVANSLARHLSALYAVTNPARRAEFIKTWHPGIADRPVLGQQFVTPKHMRELASALTTFATEWEQANA